MPYQPLYEILFDSGCEMLAEQKEVTTAKLIYRLVQISL